MLLGELRFHLDLRENQGRSHQVRGFKDPCQVGSLSFPSHFDKRRMDVLFPFLGLIESVTASVETTFV